MYDDQRQPQAFLFPQWTLLSYKKEIVSQSKKYHEFLWEVQKKIGHCRNILAVSVMGKITLNFFVVAEVSNKL